VLSAKFGNSVTVDKNYYKAMEGSVYKMMSESVAVINGFFFPFCFSTQSDICAILKERSVFGRVALYCQRYLKIYVITQNCVLVNMQLDYIITGLLILNRKNY